MSAGVAQVRAALGTQAGTSEGLALIRSWVHEAFTVDEQLAHFQRKLSAVEASMLDDPVAVARRSMRELSAALIEIARALGAE